MGSVFLCSTCVPLPSTSFIQPGILHRLGFFSHPNQQKAFSKRQVKSSCVKVLAPFFATWYIRRSWGDTSHPANPHPYSCKHVPRSRELSLVPPRWLSPPAWATIHLCPLFWTVGLDPAVGEDVLHFPSHSFSHQADKILSLHPFSCAKPEKVLKFKHIPPAPPQPQSMGWEKSCLHSGHECLLEPGENLHGLQRAGGRPTAWDVWIPGHLSTAPKASWLNSNTFTPKHLTKAEVSHSTSHSQPPHQHQNYNKNFRLLHATQSNSCHTGLVP